MKINWPNSMLDYLRRPINLHTVPAQSISETLRDSKRLAEAYRTRATIYNKESAAMSKRANELDRIAKTKSFIYYTRTGRFPND